MYCDLELHGDFSAATVDILKAHYVTLHWEKLHDLQTSTYVKQWKLDAIPFTFQQHKKEGGKIKHGETNPLIHMPMIQTTKMSLNLFKYFQSRFPFPTLHGCYKVYQPHNLAFAVFRMCACPMHVFCFWKVVGLNKCIYYL